jgi:NarL family two-component system sensor histidine kinase LiaS
MSTVQRHMLFSVALSSILAFVLLLAFFIAFPLEDWLLLWDKKILNLPFVLFILSLSIIVGLVFGLTYGNYWRKVLLNVSDALRDLEQGRKVAEEDTCSLEEIKDIWFRLNKLQKQIVEQTKISQKIANQKAEEQEKRIQEIVSQERNRLARELHDSVSQQLFAASMLMSAITESTSVSAEHITKQLKTVEQMIQQSQLEMRALLLHLRPVALKGKSLQEGMQELLNELLQKVPLEVRWKVEEFPLDKGVEDHLFRILQESISNTLRHAKATTLEVLLIQRDELIILRVVDNGMGFNLEESKTGSYGLQNMHERAVEIGGLLKVVSVPNKGTRLEVKVPIIIQKGEEDD